jgi:hypothetical protein
LLTVAVLYRDRKQAAEHASGKCFKPCQLDRFNLLTRCMSRLDHFNLYDGCS